MLDNVPAGQAWPLASPLLSDPNRGVRIRAAALLAAAPIAGLPTADRDRFERAAAEFVAAQRLNADRPEARATLGNFYARRGLSAEAEAEYAVALRLSPHFAPAAINLADLTSFSELLETESQRHDEARTLTWIKENSGPLPAEEMPSRVAGVAASLIAETDAARGKSRAQ